MNLLNENGIFHKTFSFLGQLIALNLLWMVCSLPLVTIGASTTALHYCTLKLHKYGDCNVWKDFFKSFKQNFKQSTLVWFLLLIAAGCIYLEIKSLPTMPGMMPQIFSYVVLAVCIPLIMITLYVFPTLAAFENKTRKLITNAFYFAVKNIFFTLAIAAITTLPMFFTLIDAKLFPVYLFVWLTCGFSLTSYADSWFFWKLFRPYFQETGYRKEEHLMETDQYVF